MSFPRFALDLCSVWWEGMNSEYLENPGIQTIHLLPVEWWERMSSEHLENLGIQTVHLLPIEHRLSSGDLRPRGLHTTMFGVMRLAAS